MQAVAISNGYLSGKVYIVWEVPHEGINGYDIYRNGTLLATSLGEEGEKFVSPTMFDTDHQTNLFKKDSTFKLMYVDENVSKYQKYEYKVIATRTGENGAVMEVIESNTMTIVAE